AAASTLSAAFSIGGSSTAIGGGLITRTSPALHTPRGRLSPPPPRSISFSALLSTPAANSPFARPRSPLSGPPGPPGRISALPFLNLNGCDLLYFPFFLQTRETRRARPHARPRNEKPGAACRPGSWRSFGECIFLEDSRYASQAKN